MRSAPAEGLTYRQLEATAIPESFVSGVLRTASSVGRCTTCLAPIRVGDRYREDRLREPLLGRTLSSAICRECVAEGL